MPINIPAPLVNAVKRGRATLFLGAGASKEAGFPGTKKLIDYIAQKAGTEYYDELKKLDLESISEFLYREDGYGEKWVQDKIIEFFNENMRKIKMPPSTAHDVITKIKWNRIYTTNYDRIIEYSYDSSKEKVQRILTVVEPDPVLDTRNDDAVQLIKLNGCVNEAERKTSHKLILTFSEQQEVRVKHKQFYEFLRRDSINGPIIFIGFSFTHPGANMGGTSPEFTLLEQIIRDLEGATNYHYCVMPFDDDSINGKIIKRRMESNKITIINATFGEFIDELYEMIETREIGIDYKEPIKISVNGLELKIDYSEYNKDKRHFDIVGPHLWEDDPPSVTDSLNGLDTWSSYNAKHFIERLCEDDFKEIIDSAFSKAPEIITFTASAGWGKTSLLKKVLIEYSKNGSPIFWLNPFSTIVVSDPGKEDVIINKWDEKRIDRLIGQMFSILKTNGINDENFAPIVVWDNMPERIEEALSLFRYLNNNKRKFILILSLREGEYNFIQDDHPLIKKSIIFKPDIMESRTEVLNLIDFCTRNRVASIQSPEYRDLITGRIYENQAESSILLSLYIIFDKEHRPFNQIIDSVWNSIKHENEKKLILLISSLQRFGSSYYPRLYSLVRCFPNTLAYEIIEMSNSFLDRKILFYSYYNEEPCFRTQHNLIAEQFIKSSSKGPSDIDDYFMELLECMSSNDHRDLTIIRNILKQINDYKIQLSSEEIIKEIFEITSKSTNQDWVVCHQYSKFLINREDLTRALTWTEIALSKNTNYPSLTHQKGHILTKQAMILRNNDDIERSEEYLNEARKLFSRSRFGTEPNEYGYVTHLDMLLTLLKDETNEEKRSNILAEGASLYKDGLEKITADKFNLLLDDRFKVFDLKEFSQVLICNKIQESLISGNTSTYGVIYLSEYLFKKDGLDKALEILHSYREKVPEGILTWVYEAKYLTKKGLYLRASTCLHSAKLRIRDAENTESLWLLHYLDLIVSIIRKDYYRAREAVIKLVEGRFYSRIGLARGYIWKEEAEKISRKDRILSQHAFIFEGRIENVRTSRRYGRITMRNISGDEYYIDFLPDSFGRGDIKSGDYVKFAIQIYNWGLRAESLTATPYLNTIDDFYVKQEYEVMEEEKPVKKRNKKEDEGFTFADIVVLKKGKKKNS